MDDDLLNAVEQLDAERVDRLLRDGADPNVVNPYSGTSALHLAIDAEADGAHQNNEPLTVEVTRLLLEAGADPHLRDKTGATPADVAREMGHHLALALLRERTGEP